MFLRALPESSNPQQSMLQKTTDNAPLVCRAATSSCVILRTLVLPLPYCPISPMVTFLSKGKSSRSAKRRTNPARLNRSSEACCIGESVANQCFRASQLSAIAPRFTGGKISETVLADDVASTERLVINRTAVGSRHPTTIGSTRPKPCSRIVPTGIATNKAGAVQTAQKTAREEGSYPSRWIAKHERKMSKTRK